MHHPATRQKITHTGQRLTATTYCFNNTPITCLDLGAQDAHKPFGPLTQDAWLCQNLMLLCCADAHTAYADAAHAEQLMPQAARRMIPG